MRGCTAPADSDPRADPGRHLVAAARARARLDSIRDPRDRLGAELDQARGEQAKTQTEVDTAEQATIDLTVYRSLLNEAQGKLARLEPVRIEPLR